MKYKLATALVAMAFAAPALAEDAVCYNCPPQWADWASMLEAIDKEIDIQMPHDNKNSGQTLSQLLAERNNPVADVAYYGVTTGIKAGNEGVATAYKPAKFDEIPDGLKEPDGKWFAIHYGSLGFFVNVDALGGAEDERLQDVDAVPVEPGADLPQRPLPIVEDDAHPHRRHVLGRRLAVEHEAVAALLQQLEQPDVNDPVRLAGGREIQFARTQSGARQ